jgi:hypothetical protein
MVFSGFGVTGMPTGGIFILGAWVATMILIFWLVYKQMSANAKGCPQCGYKMDISPKLFLLRISIFLVMVGILLIVGILSSGS